LIGIIKVKLKELAEEISKNIQNVPENVNCRTPFLQKTQKKKHIIEEAHIPPSIARSQIEKSCGTYRGSSEGKLLYQ
jgi:hypothetical protein